MRPQGRILPLLLVLIACCTSRGFAAGYVTDDTPPEQPEAAYNELTHCAFVNGAFGRSVSKAQIERVTKQCNASAKNVTLDDFFALKSGCRDLSQPAVWNDCVAAIKILRPSFSASGPPVSERALLLSPVQFGSLVLACNATSDPEKGQPETPCWRALLKVANLRASRDKNAH